MAMGFGLLICRAGIATSPSRTVELMGGVTGDSTLHGDWPQKLLKTWVFSSQVKCWCRTLYVQCLLQCPVMAASQVDRTKGGLVTQRVRSTRGSIRHWKKR